MVSCLFSLLHTFWLCREAGLKKRRPPPHKKKASDSKMGGLASKFACCSSSSDPYGGSTSCFGGNEGMVPKKYVLYSLYMPSFCHEEVKITGRMRDSVTQSWARIAAGQTDAYRIIVKEKTAKGDYRSTTPMVVLYDTYYSRLFDSLPAARQYFRHRSVQVQGKMLARTFGLILKFTASGDKASFCGTIRDVARRHVAMNIHPAAFSVGAECLVYSLRALLGDDWTRDVEHAWIAVVTLIMQTMVPIIVDARLSSYGEESFSKADTLTATWQEAASFSPPALNTYGSSHSLVQPSPSGMRMRRSSSIGSSASIL